MAGEMNLAKMLESLTVSVRPEPYVLITLPPDIDIPPMGNGVAAIIDEAEGPTIIATLSRAAHEEWPHDFVASWLTLDIHSALEAVCLLYTSPSPRDS